MVAEHDAMNLDAPKVLREKPINVLNMAEAHVVLNRAARRVSKAKQINVLNMAAAQDAPTV
jgi:hypothetical protein